MTPAYAYLRVSGRGQINGDGFDRQLDEIRRHADEFGFGITRVFREKAVSGTADVNDRPAFREMMSEILGNGVRTVICERLDRLAREYRVQETLLIYLASKGVTLVNAGTGEDVTAAIMGDPMKKAIVQIQGVFAELEKRLLTKKLRSARERKRNVTGKCEGRKSYSEVAPDIVGKIAELRKTKTFDGVAEELNRLGIVTLGGKPFTGSNVQMIMYRNRKGSKK